MIGLRLVKRYLGESGAKSAQGVVLLMLGVGGSQLLVFATMPLLASLYEPEAFGQLALFVSVVGVVGIASTGRLELAIPLARSHRAASTDCLLGLTLVLGVSVLAGGALALFMTLAPGTKPAVMLHGVWFLIPLAVLATGWWRILNYWHTRLEGYKVIAASYWGRAVALVAAQITLAYIFEPSGAWLVAGNCVGLFGALVLLVSPAVRGGQRIQFRGIRGRDLVESGRGNRDFLVFGTGQAVTNALSQHAMILVMSSLFVAGTLGHVSLAMKLLMFPVHLVAEAVRRVLYQKLASLDCPRQRFRIWRGVTIALAGLGGIMIAVIVIAGPQLFVAVLGEQWEEAGRYARILVFPTVFALINPPSTMAMPLLGLQSAHFRYELILLGTRVTAMIVGARVAGPAGSLWAYAGVSVLMNAWLMAFAGRRLSTAGVVTGDPAH